MPTHHKKEEKTAKHAVKQEPAAHQAPAEKKPQHK